MFDKVCFTVIISLLKKKNVLKMLNYKMVDNKCGNKSSSIDLSQYFTDNLSMGKKKKKRISSTLSIQREIERHCQRIFSFNHKVSSESEENFLLSPVKEKISASPGVLICT